METKNFVDPSSEFDFAIDADIIKAGGEKIVSEDDLDYENMWIQGIASDTNGDLEGETLNPRKFVLDYLLKVGKFTYEHLHKDDPLAAIGEPREAKITADNKFFVKGMLYSKSDLAKKVYKQTWILQSDPNSTRRMQWSIEGKRLWQDKKLIGAMITHVTLTQNPINYKGTYAEVVKKALTDENLGDIVIPEIEKGITPEREAELMLKLYEFDNTIYSDILKAENFVKVMDYCDKNFPIESGIFFKSNPIEKLTKIFDGDLVKSFDRCNVLFHLIKSLPASEILFMNDPSKIDRVLSKMK